MLKEEEYDKIMDRLYGSTISRLGGDAKFTDIMNCGERVDLDVEQIPDCDSREDFLQLRSLERTMENFEQGEYNYNDY